MPIKPSPKFLTKKRKREQSNLVRESIHQYSMKKKLTSINLYSLITLLLLLTGNFDLYSQEDNRPPTKEELKAKQARLASLNWRTGLGKVNSITGVMVTGPEQNCSNAIEVCSQTYNQSTSYTGIGSVQEVNASTCLAGGETNSVWYIFTAQTSGTFGFTLATTRDYDFALYNITTIGCAGYQQQHL